MAEIKFQLDNRRRGAFYVEEDGKQVGEMVIGLSETTLTVYHTEVDPAMEGRGLARIGVGGRGRGRLRRDGFGRGLLVGPGERPALVGHRRGFLHLRRRRGPIAVADRLGRGGQGPGEPDSNGERDTHGASVNRRRLTLT